MQSNESRPTDLLARATDALYNSDDIEVHEGDLAAALRCRIWEQLVWAAVDFLGVEHHTTNGSDGVDGDNARAVKLVANELMTSLNLSRFFY